MVHATDIPDDENGAVLRSMLKDGDDLSKPRMIDFCHIFTERWQALKFAESVDDRELEVCISYNDERDMWDAIVKRFMVADHREITAFELSMAEKAKSVGGLSDGWGCFVQKGSD
jgi:hypothetical protein